MAKKIAGIEGDVIVAGGVVVGGYFLIKNLFPDLLPNLGVSDADRTVLDAQQTSPPAQNIFSTQFPSMLSWLANNSDAEQFETSDEYMVASYQDYTHGNMSPNNPLYSTMQIYMDLSTALVGHIFSGDQEGAISALNRITNKYQVGLIAYLFSLINGIDLWSLLRRGSPWSTMRYGLHGTDLAQAVKRLNTLPD